jgi:hypothetical protein
VQVKIKISELISIQDQWRNGTGTVYIWNTGTGMYLRPVLHTVIILKLTYNLFLNFIRLIRASFRVQILKSDRLEKTIYQHHSGVLTAF